MTEAELLRKAGQLCGRYDVQLHHHYQPLHDQAGWPDCSLLGTQAVAFRELKTAHGRLSAAQQEVRDRMTRAGFDWGLWRPCDLESGRIEREIAALSGKTPWTAV